MVCRNRNEEDDRRSSSSSSSSIVNDALLLTTMCLIGLPVDVHIKDGSVYSGIFHTASVHDPYGMLAFVDQYHPPFLVFLILI